MKDLIIEKKDGRIEKWSDDKIVISIAKSGVPLNEAEDYAAKIKKWAKSKSNNGTIKSNLLKDRVITELEKNYPVEAENYKNYKRILQTGDYNQ